MKATVVDLRYRMHEVLKALERREDVTVFSHGKIKGVIRPVQKKKKMRVKDHPFFGMTKGESESVVQVMDRLRGAVIVLFDTDVIIWVQRGNADAAKAIDAEAERAISAFTYLELLQNAQNRAQLEQTASFLRSLECQTLPLTENIGHRAAIYLEEYTLAHGLRAGDAIIAATAAENGLILCSGNAKHFRHIHDLRFKAFNP